MTVQLTVSCKTILKEVKEGKEVKEILKERFPDHKTIIKDLKESTHDKNLLKDTIKDVKEVAKELKEVAKEVKEAGFENWPGRPGGGGYAPEQAADPGVEARLSALEAAVFGGADQQGGQVFIDGSLRPDLMGAPGSGVVPPDDAQGKRQLDTPPSTP